MSDEIHAMRIGIEITRSKAGWYVWTVETESDQPLTNKNISVSVGTSAEHALDLACSHAGDFLKFIVEKNGGKVARRNDEVHHDVGGEG